MKKTFMILGILMCVYACVACGKAHEHQFGEWKIVEEATCGKNGYAERVCSCGEKETETIYQTNNHTYTSEVQKEPTTAEPGVMLFTCTVCGHTKWEPIDKIVSKWKVDYYVDEFGDKTKDAFVAGIFEGKFTTDIARDSDMVAIVYLDKSEPDMTQIRCLKYGKTRPSYDSKDTAEMKVKLDNGNTKTYEFTCYDGEFFCADPALVADIMGNDEVSCVITVYEKYNIDDVDDTYKFKIDRVGLSELYEQTK